MVPEPQRCLSFASKPHSSGREVEMCISNIDHSLLQRKDDGRREERGGSRVKMFYFCCQHLWLKTKKLQDWEPGMSSVWEASQGGRKTKCLGFTTIICIGEVLQPLRLSILFSYCKKKPKATGKTQHPYESQNPYPNFLNGETDEGLSCTKQAECRWGGRSSGFLRGRTAVSPCSIAFPL